MVEEAVNNLKPSEEDMAVEAMSDMIASSYTHSVLTTFKMHRPKLNQLARMYVTPGVEDKERLEWLNNNLPIGTSGEIKSSSLGRFSQRFRDHLKLVKGRCAHQDFMRQMYDGDETEDPKVVAFNARRINQLNAMELASARTPEDIDTNRMRAILTGIRYTHRMSIEEQSIALERDRDMHRAAKAEAEVALLQQKFERAEKQFADEAAARQAKNSDGKLTQEDIDEISAAVFGAPGGGR